MVLLRDIKGQDNAVKYLTRSLDAGRIANSYLFSGPLGVGKALTAKAFIKELLCPHREEVKAACGKCPSCLRIEKLDHPDIVWIKPEKNRLIKIEEVRKVKDLLSLKPYEASRGVCVIEDAHMMREEAQNALLKLLEEPPGDSTLIIISDKKELLLSTVLSRCSLVRFRFLSYHDAKSIIMEESDASREEAEFLAYFTQGSPGRALKLLEEGFEDHRSSITSMIREVAREDKADFLNWGSDTKDQLLEDIEVLIAFLRDVTVCKEGLYSLLKDKGVMESESYRVFSSFSHDRIYKIVQSLIDMKLALSGNLNPKLAAEVLPGILK